MLNFLNYEFIQQALIIGVALGLSAALLSPFLVLNQQAMIADGLAHVSFAGIILGIILANEALWIAIPFVMLASLLIKYLSTTKNNQWRCCYWFSLFSFLCYWLNYCQKRTRF